MDDRKKQQIRRRVERELRYIAFANAADYLEILEAPQEGRLVKTMATSRLTVGKKAAIAAIKEGKNGVEVKLKDPIKAMELLCRLNGIMTQEAKQAEQGNLEELMKGLRELGESEDQKEDGQEQDGEDEDDL